MSRDKYWRAPDWLSDGDTVWLPMRQADESGKTRVTKCTVFYAAGDLARVVSETHGIDRWVRLDALLVGPDDIHHPNQMELTMKEIMMALKGETT